MDLLETDDLRLLYFDPLQTYLTPYVARSFHNSLQFQRRVFDWTPYEKARRCCSRTSPTTAMRGASASPRNNVILLDSRRSSHTLRDVLPGSERMYSLMNHEPVHVATMDACEQRPTRAGAGSSTASRADDEHPESILYNYLATPRVNVPRWYLEGSAVFMETWMAGGFGRAQGGYDEMVFRAMVRDDAHFYSPLGLVSEGASPPTSRPASTPTSTARASSAISP